MENTPEPARSDFDPRHRQLPSVELPLTDRQLWLHDSDDHKHSPRSSGSRIPRPVTRSKEESPLPGAVPTNHIRGFENPVFNHLNEDKPGSSQGPRQPRYGFNMYNSYEEMLANMESDDPFGGQAPPPKTPKEDSSLKRSSSTTRSQRHQNIAMEPMPGKVPPPHHKAHSHSHSHATEEATHKRRHKKKPKDSPAANPKEDLRSTYTVSMRADPPPYDSATATKQRRSSVGSTGTFTVGRADSRTQLVSGDANFPGSPLNILVNRDTSGAPEGGRRDSWEGSQQALESSLVHGPPPPVPALPPVSVQGMEHMWYTAAREETMYLRDPTTSSYQSAWHLAALRRYVQGNFKNPQCKKYVRDSKSADLHCQCGYNIKWHEKRSIKVDRRETKEKWLPETHTQLINTTSYGTICFDGFGQEASKSAPYIRVNADTNNLEAGDTKSLETCWTLLREYWDMPEPKLIISVTGGAKRFFMKPRLKSSFKRGLVNAATTTGAWIVTGGTATGVMEFVGEAVKDHMLATGGSGQKIAALGIATWGIVDNKNSLIGGESGLFPARYHIDGLSAKDVRGVAPLDHNHTHFILVDNGTQGKFGKEITFRTALEKYISENKETGVAKNQSVHVPVVILVLEGGENTIKTAKQGIEHETPVVVVQGSGRAADLIAYAYGVTRSKDGNEDESFFPSNFEEECKIRALNLLDWSREHDPKEKEKKIAECVKNVKVLLDYRRLVTVFALDDVDTTNEIDQAILFALLKANKSNAESQLNLALAWNRCDVARQQIFSIENRRQWEKKTLNDAMFTALIQDRVDFVQLFMDNGVKLEKFLTVRRLRDLYDDAICESGISSSLLRHLVQQEQQAWNPSFISCYDSDTLEDDMPNLLAIVGCVINFLLGDQQQNLYQADKYLIHDRTGYEIPEEKQSQYPSHPARELFLWAVLLNRKGLALLFWKVSRDHIGGALTASALFKSLASEADKEEEMDLSAELVKNAQEFEELAMGVLNECYQRDKVMAHKLLVRELSTWGYTTLLTIADSAQQMDFMCHTACQTKLNKIWKGKMALYTSTWKILSALFLPFIIPLIKFSTNELKYNQQQETEAFLNDPAAPNQIAPRHVPGGRDPGGHGQGGSEKKKNAKKSTLYEVEMWSCCKTSQNINFCNALFYYHTAPVVKFCYHTISQVIFLALFSFFVLTDLRPASEHNSPGVVEIIVWAWAATLLVEEIRQITSEESHSFKYKVSGYFDSMWNRFDLFMYIMFITSIILRYTLGEKDFIWARMFYALTLSMYYLRFMHVFFVEKEIGPKVIMIRRMLTDLMFFLCILIIFILAYGVTSQALRYPNAEVSWVLLKDVVYMPYWQLYGELFLEELEGDVPDCTKNETELALNPNLERCPEESWLVIVLFALYMILTNILLLNLLIAMFSYTFEKVQENSEKVWRFYRYGLIYEYFDRPTLAPPLIIITHIWRVMKFFYRKCKNIKKVSNDFRTVLSKEDQNKLTTFERSAMENHLFRQHLSSREHIDVKVTSAGERIEKVIEELDQIKEQVSYKNEMAAMTDENKVVPALLDYPSSSRYDARDDIGIMQSRITGLEEQLLIQRGQLALQQQQMQQALDLLHGLSGHGVTSGSRRGAFLPPGGTMQEPQIEIQDFRDESQI